MNNTNTNTKKVRVGTILQMIFGFIIIIFFGLSFLMSIILNDSFSFINLILIMLGIFLCYYSIKTFPSKGKVFWQVIIFVSVSSCIFMIFFSVQSIQIAKVINAKSTAQNAWVMECRSKCKEGGVCFCNPHGFNSQPDFFDILLYKK